MLGASAGLDLCDVGKHCRLGSSRLREWSPFIRKLLLNDDSCKTPGLTAFMEANAGGLQALDLECFSPLTAAVVDHVIPSCRMVSNLNISGSQVLSLSTRRP